MADIAACPSSTTSAPGPVWLEFTNAANVVLNSSGTNSGATVVTVGLPSTGAGSLPIVSTLPIAVTVLNQANIQGAKNGGLPAGVGIANIVWTNSVDLTLTLVNSGAATNVNANTRWLLIQNNGV